VGIQMQTVGPLWLRAMVNTAGTVNLDWFLQRLCAEEWGAAARDGTSIYAWAEAEAASVPIGADGVLYHPYLNTTGVISPFFHPGARAQFFGLGLDHTRAHMLRAVYEGVALAMADCSRALPVEVAEWFVAGGGARSRFWCQMFADCTGKTILVPDGEEFGARGVAVLAGMATGVYRDLDDAMRRTIRVKRRHDPDPAAAARYADLYGLYRSVHEHLRDDWWRRFHMLNRFQES
jgi:sugar (pentulose or hexulose) kinase